MSDYIQMWSDPGLCPTAPGYNQSTQFMSAFLFGEVAPVTSSGFRAEIDAERHVTASEIMPDSGAANSILHTLARTNKETHTTVTGGATA